jgi:hypothetical protein
MADDQQEIRRVNWTEVLPVTHVFKSFRMAIHAGKLVLALAAVLLIGAWGLIMDGATGWAGAKVLPDEIVQHATTSPAAFQAWQGKAAAARTKDIDDRWQKAIDEEKDFVAYKKLLQAEIGPSHFFNAFVDKMGDADAVPKPKPDKTTPEERKALAQKDWPAAFARAERVYKQAFERIDKGLAACSDGAAKKKIADDKGLDTPAKKEAAEAKRKADQAAAARALTRLKVDTQTELGKIRGSGIFHAMQRHEGWCLDGAIAAARRLNIAGGMRAYLTVLDERAEVMAPTPAPAAEAAPAVAPTIAAAAPTAAPTQAPALAFAFAPADEAPGVLCWALIALQGFGWLFCQHWLYAIVFLAVALAIWALFGGAIHRIAALHFARDEKISMGTALKFAAGKFISFYTAPLIPLGISIFIGLFLLAGGFLLGSWGGGILMGLLFPLAILGGMLIAFLVVGLAGGAGLMYPTIAVESSDSFDAISRSYSYIFGKPWRAAFYALAALVYGVICYLFIRLFAFVVLAATHAFVGAGALGGGEALSPAADRLDLLWPAPTFDHLLSSPCWQAMSFWETIGAGLIWFWVMLVAASVLAFLVSYCASANTAIYYLLRRTVDATDLDDVFVDEVEEAPAGEPAPPTAEPAKPADQPKPAEPAAGETKVGGDGGEQKA